MADLTPSNGRPGRNVSFGARDPLDSNFDLDGHPKSSTEFVGIREYVAIVRRHLWIVLGVLILAVSYTANSVRKERPQYRSYSTVRLIDTRRAITGDMSMGNAEAPYSYQVDPIQSQLQVLTSDAVAQVAVDMKGLRLVPVVGDRFVDQITEVTVADNPSTTHIRLAFTPGGYSIESRGRAVSAPYGNPAEIDGIRLTVTSLPPTTSTSLDVVSREEAVGRALGGFQPAGREKTDILDLIYVGYDPYESRRIANAMAEAFQEQNASTAQQLSRRRRSFLEGQLRQTDSALARATAAFTAFRSGRQVFNSATRAGAQEQSLIDIDTRRAELDADKRSFETLLAQARSGGDKMGANLRVLISSPGIAANPVVQELYRQLTDYEKQRDVLVSSGAAPSNPDLVAVNGLLKTTSSNLIDAVESHVQSLSSRITALDRLRSAGASRVAAAPAAETQEMELNQQVTTFRALADQLQQDLQRARMSEAVEAGQVQIVQLAMSPGSRIATGQSRKLLAGILVGLLLGFGAAVVVDGLDASIRKRSDIMRLLGVPGLAVIPRLAGETNPSARMLRALPRLKSGNGKDPSRSSADLVTVSNVRSAAAEAFRTLRTNLMFSQTVSSMRTLVVTSASPGEGKTTTASNLAVSFAQQGMRVLIIDCDLRRARLHRLFNVPREPGFSDLVLGFKNEDDVTSPTSVPGLYVIPSGKLPPNPAELLGSEHTARTLMALTEGFDLVIVDTPPLLAASDAAILATLANGVLIVLRAGSTESAAAQQSIQQLNSLGARVVGAVLNDPDAQVPKYGAYYKYDYSTVES